MLIQTGGHAIKGRCETEGGKAGEALKGMTSTVVVSGARWVVGKFCFLYRTISLALVGFSCQ